MDRTIYRNIAQLLPILALMWTSAQASELDVPHTFVAGQPALAAEVNANFTAVETAVNDNHDRIAALEAQIATLQAYIDDLQEVIALQNDAQGYPSVAFTGVNVYVNNGMGTTNTINGLGNLIVGYNEARTVVQVPTCSKGEYDNVTDCETNGGTWAVGYKTGSHNLIIGEGHNYSRYGGFVTGFENIINGFNASVSGGVNNWASGTSSSISGGGNNKAIGGFSSFSSISGGTNNAASGLFSTVSGGNGNTASGDYSTVSGGSSNVADENNEHVP